MRPANYKGALVIDAFKPGSLKTGHQISRLTTFSAFFSMKSLRGST